MKQEITCIEKNLEYDMSPKPTIKLFMQVVPINRGGYDCAGTYWGVGEPLYRYWTETSDIMYTRALNREHAKKLIRKTFNTYNVVFYR